MSPKELTAFRIAPEIMDAMRRMKAETGVPIARQVEFALTKWLKAEGFAVKAPSRRVRAQRKG